MVTLPWRRRRLPAGARPTLEADERILAWASTTDDQIVIATNRGLWLPGAAVDPPRRAGRLGWHEIHKVSWSGRQLSIIAATEVADEGAYRVMADLPAVTHTLLDPDGVPEQVRQRVNRSVAYTAHHPVPGAGGVRVVGRRVSGVDGLQWTARYDDGVDRHAPGVAAATADLVVAAQASTRPAV